MSGPSLSSLPTWGPLPCFSLLLSILHAGTFVVTRPRNRPENLGWYPRSPRSKILLVPPPPRRPLARSFSGFYQHL